MCEYVCVCLGMKQIKKQKLKIKQESRVCPLTGVSLHAVSDQVSFAWLCFHIPCQMIHSFSPH